MLPFDLPWWVAAPVVLWAAQHLLVWYLVLTKHRVNLGFRFEAVDEATLDEADLAHLRAPEQEGFRTIGVRRMVDHSPGIEALVALHRDDARRMFGAAYVLRATAAGRTVRVLEVVMRDGDGIAWTITNSPELPMLALPWRRLCRYPERTEFARILAAGTAIAGIVERRAPRDQLPARFGFEELAELCRRESRYAVEIGHCREDSDGIVRPTLTGALIMGLRFIWPWRSLFVAVDLARSRRLLAEAQRDEDIGRGKAA